MLRRRLADEPLKACNLSHFGAFSSYRSDIIFARSILYAVAKSYCLMMQELKR